MYVLTYIKVMLRHIKLKKLHMSRLFCTFASRKDKIIKTLYKNIQS